MGDVRELLRRVEAGDLWAEDAIAVSVEAGALIERGLGILHDSDDYDDIWSAFVGAYDGSLDDTLALHEAMLPGWGWLVNGYRGYASVWLPEDGGPQAEYQGAVEPSRALLIAILRALSGGR